MNRHAAGSGSCSGPPHVHGFGLLARRSPVGFAGEPEGLAVRACGAGHGEGLRAPKGRGPGARPGNEGVPRPAHHCLNSHGHLQDAWRQSLIAHVRRRRFEVRCLAALWPVATKGLRCCTARERKRHERHERRGHGPRAHAVRLEPHETRPPSRCEPRAVETGNPPGTAAHAALTRPESRCRSTGAPQSRQRPSRFHRSRSSRRWDAPQATNPRPAQCGQGLRPSGHVQGTDRPFTAPPSGARRGSPRGPAPGSDSTPRCP